MSKFSFSLIFGSVFALVGAVFTAVAVVVTLNIDAIMASPNSQGDVRILPIVFGGIGIIFLIIGIPFLAHHFTKRKNIKRIIAEGYYIMAKVSEVRPNYAVRINGIHPYLVECRYEDPSTGNIHVFKSDDVMHCPDYLLDTEIKVYVDRNNYGIYHVDLENVVSKVIVH